MTTSEKNPGHKNIAPQNIPAPTVGRIVLISFPGKDSLPMMVSKVVAPYTINGTVFNEDGSIGGVEWLPHAHKADKDIPSWDWMPYQYGQAAKAEELEKELETEMQRMAKAVGRDADKGVPSHHRTDNELSKMQAGSPSPVDGKR